LIVIKFDLDIIFFICVKGMKNIQKGVDYNNIVGIFEGKLNDKIPEFKCQAWTNLYLIMNTMRQKSVTSSFLTLFAHLPYIHFYKMTLPLLEDMNLDPLLLSNEFVKNNIDDFITSIQQRIDLMSST
jgi:hypothetical protein